MYVSFRESILGSRHPRHGSNGLRISTPASRQLRLSHLSLSVGSFTPLVSGLLLPPPPQLPRAWKSQVYTQDRLSPKLLSFTFCLSVCPSRLPLSRQTPSRNQTQSAKCSKLPATCQPRVVLQNLSSLNLGKANANHMLLTEFLQVSCHCLLV